MFFHLSAAVSTWLVAFTSRARAASRACSCSSCLRPAATFSKSCRAPTATAARARAADSDATAAAAAAAAAPASSLPLPAQAVTRARSSFVRERSAWQEASNCRSSSVPASGMYRSKRVCFQGACVCAREHVCVNLDPSIVCVRVCVCVSMYASTWALVDTCWYVLTHLFFSVHVGRAHQPGSRKEPRRHNAECLVKRTNNITLSFVSSPSFSSCGARLQ